MRKYARKDDNQDTHVAAHLKAGFSVQSLAPMGNGVPDLAIGVPVEPFSLWDNATRIGIIAGFNLLSEIKDPNKPASKRRLSDDEETWHRQWLGQVDTHLWPQRAVAQARALQRRVRFWCRLERRAREDIRWQEECPPAEEA